jgi:hypothetical protein
MWGIAPTLYILSIGQIPMVIGSWLSTQKPWGNVLFFKIQIIDITVLHVQTLQRGPPSAPAFKVIIDYMAGR